MNQPIILFDGVCNLCTRSVQVILAHDPYAQFRFASLQSRAGKQLAQERGIDTAQPDTMLVLDGMRWYGKSDAALFIAGHMSGIWRYAAVLRMIPRPLRDWVYDQLAKRRYGLFGQANVCWTPTPELEARFLSNE